MNKKDLRLKTNIKIYNYTTIKVIKYYFGDCKLLWFFYFGGSWSVTPGQSNG
jgi:hypothetical protein